MRKHIMSDIEVSYDTACFIFLNNSYVKESSDNLVALNNPPNASKFVWFSTWIFKRSGFEGGSRTEANLEVISNNTHRLRT